MNFVESETVELKSTVVADLCKEIIAFANAKGGTIYIGVEDDGTVVGVEGADRVTLQVNNMVRDSIKPDVTMFVRYETQTVEGRQIIAVTVQKGTDRPYYLGIFTWEGPALDGQPQQNRLIGQLSRMIYDAMKGESDK